MADGKKSISFGEFIDKASGINSFDLSNGQGDSVTLYWRELKASDPMPDITDYMLSVEKEDLSQEAKTFKIMRHKWREEAFIKLQLGMEEMGEEPITREEWDAIPEGYMEVILSHVGVANSNFFSGSKKAQKP